MWIRVIERRSPKTAWRSVGRAGLEIVGVVEWSRAGEEEGGPCWVKLGSCERERGDVEGLEMGVCMAVDLQNNNET